MRLLLVFALACVVAGCSRPLTPEPEQSSPTEPAAPVVTKSAPPYSPDQKPTVQNPPPKQDWATPNAGAPAVDRGEKDLEAYSKRLWVVMGARDVAERQFQDDVRKAAPKLDEQNIGALLEPYRKFAKAVERAKVSLSEIKAPAEALRLHNVLLSNIERLDENLQLAVDAIEVGQPGEFAQYQEERARIQREGGDAARDALVAAGFDLEKYGSEHRLVKKK